MPSFQMTPLLASDGLTLRRVVCDGVDCSRPAEERCESPRVVMLLQGRFAFRDPATRAVASPAVALRLRGGHDYRVSHPDGGDVCLCLQGALARALVDDGPTASPVSAPGYVAVQRLATRLSDGSPLTALEIEETICTALTAEAPSRPSRPRDREVATVMTYHLDRDLDARLTLVDVARTAGISPFHACRVFRRATGFSIHGYQRESRLRHALALVLDTDRSIAQIAVDLGFANQGHLTNLFRRRFRTTPAWARRQGGASCTL
jgi:AraC-like DNA-binding protein